MKREGMDFGLRDALKTSREIKQESKIQAVTLGGTSGDNLEQVEEQVDQTLSKLLSENENWINEQKNKVLEVLSGVEDTKVLQTFRDGLRTFFQQQYRLLTKDQKKHSKKTPIILKNRKYIHQQIVAYTFDFIQSLKSSQREGLTSIQALELAKLSYHYNPDALRKLSEKYPDTNQVVIKRALLSYPSNPEKFIDEYITRVEELTQKYPDIDTWVINHVAISNSLSAEKFLDSYISKVNKLVEQYPDIEIFIIKEAAISYSSNTEKFLASYIAKIKELTESETYRNVDQTAIKRAALRSPPTIKNPLNTENFLDNYIAKVKQLRENEKYRNVDQHVIRHAALNYTSNPEKFIDKYLIRVKELIQEYPDINPGLIRRIARSYTSKPKQFIDEYIAKVKELTERYPNVDLWVITEAANSRPRNPESFIEEHKNDKSIEAGIAGHE